MCFMLEELRLVQALSEDPGEISAADTELQWGQLGCEPRQSVRRRGCFTLFLSDGAECRCIFLRLVLR